MMIIMAVRPAISEVTCRITIVKSINCCLRKVCPSNPPALRGSPPKLYRYAVHLTASKLDSTRPATFL